MLQQCPHGGFVTVAENESFPVSFQECMNATFLQLLELDMFSFKPSAKTGDESNLPVCDFKAVALFESKAAKPSMCGAKGPTQ